MREEATALDTPPAGALPARREIVRRRIMDAALVCLRRNGFAGVTTRELLSEAGLAVGTFYKYFPSKEELYEALAEELVTAEVQRVLDCEKEPAGVGLLRFLRDSVLADRDAAEAVAAFRARLRPHGEGSDAVRRLNHHVVVAFLPLLERAQREGYARDDIDTEAVVELLDIVWDGLGRRGATDAFHTDFDRVGRALLDLLVQGVVAQPSGTMTAASSVARRRRPASGSSSEAGSPSTTNP